MSSSNTWRTADIPELDDPILDWWKVKERKWPALAKMVKQYFAVPHSLGVGSGGVVGGVQIDATAPRARE